MHFIQDELDESSSVNSYENEDTWQKYVQMIPTSKYVDWDDIS